LADLWGVSGHCLERIPVISGEMTTTAALTIPFSNMTVKRAERCARRPWRLDRRTVLVADFAHSKVMTWDASSQNSKRGRN
jgi:hypothetical protein